MRLLLTVIFGVMLSAISTAQTYRGEVTYELIMGFTSKPEPITGALVFNESQALFEWQVENTGGTGETEITEEQKDDRNVEISFIKNISVDSVPRLNYLNRISDSLITRRQWLDNKTYFIKERIPRLNWKMHQEQKVISGYTCFLATTHFRGRDYQAWFTPEIPISFGPWKLQGLPGLILEVYDEAKSIWIGAQKIRLQQDAEFPEPPNMSGGIQISIQEYAVMQANFADYLLDTEAFTKKLKAQMPRGTTVKIETNTKSNFLEKDFKDLEE